jgi:hypothetical protein
MTDTAKQSERLTPVMLAALRHMDRGGALVGHYSAITFRALYNAGYVEDSFTITDAGRAALKEAQS